MLGGVGGGGVERPATLPGRFAQGNALQLENS